MKPHELEPGKCYKFIGAFDNILYASDNPEDFRVLEKEMRQNDWFMMVKDLGPFKGAANEVHEGLRMIKILGPDMLGYLIFNEDDDVFVLLEEPKDEEYQDLYKEELNNAVKGLGEN